MDNSQTERWTSWKLIGWLLSAVAVASIASSVFIRSGSFSLWGVIAIVAVVLCAKVSHLGAIIAAVGMTSGAARIVDASRRATAALVCVAVIPVVLSVVGGLNRTIRIVSTDMWKEFMGLAWGVFIPDIVTEGTMGVLNLLFAIGAAVWVWAAIVVVGAVRRAEITPMPIRVTGAVTLLVETVVGAVTMIAWVAPIIEMPTGLSATLWWLMQLLPAISVLALGISFCAVAGAEQRRRRFADAPIALGIVSRAETSGGDSQSSQSPRQIT